MYVYCKMYILPGLTNTVEEVQGRVERALAVARDVQDLLQGEPRQGAAHGR